MHTQKRDMYGQYDMLYEILKIQKGITAAIGGGGKTTLLRTLAWELAAIGSVVVATSTHIYPMEEMCVLPNATQEELARSLGNGIPLCIGTPTAKGKFSAPSVPFYRLAELADFVLVEADGSKGLPLKAHLPYEPVIPPHANQVICVVGAQAAGQRVAQCAHRPELYAALAGCTVTDMVTPEMAATVLEREHLHTQVLVNQIDTPEQARFACQMAQKLHCPVTGGSLQKGELQCLL